MIRELTSLRRPPAAWRPSDAGQVAECPAQGLRSREATGLRTTDHVLEPRAQDPGAVMTAGKGAQPRRGGTRICTLWGPCRGDGTCRWVFPTAPTHTHLLQPPPDTLVLHPVVPSQVLSNVHVHVLLLPTAPIPAHGTLFLSLGQSFILKLSQNVSTIRFWKLRSIQLSRNDQQKGDCSLHAVPKCLLNA